MEGRMKIRDQIIDKNNIILVTGAGGFIGSRVLNTLLECGFINIRCLVQKSADADVVKGIAGRYPGASVETLQGDLLRKNDCQSAVKGVSVIFHLAAGFGKSFRHIYKNTVLATRNLLDAAVGEQSIKRFLGVSSFTVYSTGGLQRGAILDETCEVYRDPGVKGEAYCCGKVKQEEMLLDYNKRYGLPYVIVRPGYVYGPGNREISGRVGISKLNTFFHLGGSNLIPVSFVQNCADAIVLAGITGGVEGQVFNVVDDDQPSSSQFLAAYKKNVRPLRTIPVPRMVSYMLCALWGFSARISGGRLPLTYNLYRWSDDWKGNRYSNRKLRELLGWEQRVSLEVGMAKYFEYCSGTV
jgi:nucleoside-diphosphate-sugar epimerase